MKLAVQVCLVFLMCAAGAMGDHFGGEARRGGHQVGGGGGQRGWEQQGFGRGGQEWAGREGGGLTGSSQDRGIYRTNLIYTPDSYGYEATYPGGRARYINHRSPQGSFGAGGIGVEAAARSRGQQQFSGGNRDQWNQ